MVVLYRSGGDAGGTGRIWAFKMMERRPFFELERILHERAWADDILDQLKGDLLIAAFRREQSSWANC